MSQALSLGAVPANAVKKANAAGHGGAMRVALIAAGASVTRCSRCVGRGSSSARGLHIATADAAGFNASKSIGRRHHLPLCESVVRTYEAQEIASDHARDKLLGRFWVALVEFIEIQQIL